MNGTGHQSAYPRRPRFFALRFVRLLTKKTIANELGPQAFTLLSVIAVTEDARGYTDPVTFYNNQLLPLVGLGSVSALDRVRGKCVEAGWLSYLPGGRRLGPGRYYVVIPDRHRETDDAPTDEHDEADGLLRMGAEQTGNKPGANRGTNRVQTEESSSRSPSLSRSAAGAAGRASKKPEKKSRKQTCNPDHNAAIVIFTSAWSEKHGKAYPFTRGKDGIAVKAILANTDNDLDSFRRLTALYLSSSDQFLVDAGHSLSLMRSRLPGLLAADSPTRAHRVKLAADNPAVANSPGAPPMFDAPKGTR
jgi:hypothetical protein